MHIRKAILIVFILLISITAHSQMVWENYRNEVYNYLSRMSQKGFINFNDLISPLTRTTIYKALNQLEDKSSELSKTELRELLFYLQEYKPTSDTCNPRFFKPDENKRWRSFHYADKSLLINADPIIQGGLFIGDNNIRFIHRAIGANIWGSIGKHIGFQLYAADISLNGNGSDTSSIPNSLPGFVRQSDTSLHNAINYSEIRVNIGYQWKNGSISIGQDNLIWGYGENGKMVLSDKAPPYPMIRLDYQPTKWLSFNYMHAWLNSNILDSARTYSYNNTVYGGHREFFIPKFLATHTLTFKPSNKWDISVGESMVYSDKLNIGFFIPIMYFKGYDNTQQNGHNLVGNNAQIFLQTNSRNWIKKTQIYATLFVDEIRLSKVFSPDSNRNQIGYNVGINIGQAAGQTIMHLHIHVIPRYVGDVEDPRGGVRGVVPEKQKY